MENIPEFKIIGTASEEEKREFESQLVDSFLEQRKTLKPEDIAWLASHERTKDAVELALIDFANTETNNILTRLGFEPINILPDNYYNVPSDLEVVQKILDGASAITDHRRQAIVIDSKRAESSPILFGKIALHKTLHLKSFELFQVNEYGENRIFTKNLRAGVWVGSVLEQNKKNRHFHLEGLNEAITSTMEKEHYPRMLEVLRQINEKLVSGTDKSTILKSKKSQKTGLPEDEISWVSEDGSDFGTFSYFEQRRVLQYVVNEIQGQIPEAYKDSASVLEEFYRAYFSGNLINIARMMKETFGPVGLRVLGNMTGGPSSCIPTLEALKKMRLEKIRNDTKR